MHELAMARAIVAIAGEEAEGYRVTRVRVRIGHLRQVVPSALCRAFTIAAAGTPVAGAQLEIEHVPVAGRCRACGEESAMSGLPLRCGACGGLEVDVVAGEELLVESIELEASPQEAC
jgi:hydrogenase nickel incorporation protein HypA/HybF